MDLFLKISKKFKPGLVIINMLLVLFLTTSQANSQHGFSTVFSKKTASFVQSNQVVQVYTPLFHLKTKALISTLNPSDTTRKGDRDGDGVADSLDKCPDEKGVIQYDGCPVPDSDNDGIADDADTCPTIAGLAKYHGCPAPDKDGDKINDEDDKCPNVPGLARYQGCPVGDKDGDGVNDDDDKCVDLAGPAANSGCPETKKTTKGQLNSKMKKGKK